jgi:hypothetical protein
MSRVRTAVKGSAVALAWWGVELLILTSVQLVFRFDALPFVLLAGAGLAVVLASIAVAAALPDPGRPRDAASERPRRVPDLSIGSALLPFGLAAMVVGAQVGAWLVLVGAGIVALAVGNLIREWLGIRRHAHGQATIPLPPSPVHGDPQQ